MARGETIGATKLRQHARHCLRCQAEMSRERRIQRELHALRSEIPVPDGLSDHILESIETYYDAEEVGSAISTPQMKGQKSKIGDMDSAIK